MWLSGQYKRPADSGEGQTGIVTMSGGELAVMLDSERRGLEVYAPAGYRWTPRVGRRVLVIQGQGEIPCVVGERQDGDIPDRADIQAGQLTLEGERVKVDGRDSAALRGRRVELEGEIYVNGETLEAYITRLIIKILGGAGG